jgi:hypothetical protein
MGKSKYNYLIVSVICFFITTFFDSLVFIDSQYYRYSKYIILKSIVLIIIVCFWKFIYFLIDKIKKRDKKWIEISKIFIIYFSIMLIMLLLVWPGIWIWDEYSILESAKGLTLVYWHCYLTSIYYILCLMIFPFPIGIIIIQLLLISVVVTYIIFKISNKTKLGYYMLIPFLLPPVIAHNLYPMRLSLYSYILIFTIFFLIFKYKEKVKNILEIKNMILLSLLISILAVWRSEGIFYLFAIPFIIFIFFRKQFKIQEYISFIFITLMFFIILFMPQYLRTREEYRYKLTAILNPLSIMLNDPHLKNLQDVESNFSQAINLQVLKENASYTETPAFWYKQDELIGQNFNKQKYEIVKKNYFYLVRKNPLIFLKARIKTFLASSGLDKNISNSLMPYNLSADENETIKNFLVDNKFTKPINSNIRKIVGHFIGCRNYYNGSIPMWQHFIFWNLIPVYLLLFLFGVISLIRKNYLLFVISILLVMHSGLVFLTAPAYYFMYYLPIYLSVYVIVMYLLINFKNRNRNDKNEKNN